MLYFVCVEYCWQYSRTEYGCDITCYKDVKKTSIVELGPFRIHQTLFNENAIIIFIKSDIYYQITLYNFI